MHTGLSVNRINTGSSSKHRDRTADLSNHVAWPLCLHICIAHYIGPATTVLLDALSVSLTLRVSTKWNHEMGLEVLGQ